MVIMMKKCSFQADSARPVALNMERNKNQTLINLKVQLKDYYKLRGKKKD